MITKCIATIVIALSFFTCTAHAAQDEIRYGRLSFTSPHGYSHYFSEGSLQGVWIRAEKMLQDDRWERVGSLKNPKASFYAELMHELCFPTKVDFYSWVGSQYESNYEIWPTFLIFAYVLLPENTLLQMTQTYMEKESALPDYLNEFETNPSSACYDMNEVLKLYKEKTGGKGGSAYFIPSGYFDSPLIGYEYTEFFLMTEGTRITVILETVKGAKPANMPRPSPAPLPPIKIEKALGQNTRYVARQEGEEVFTLESRSQKFYTGQKKRFHAVFTSTGPVYKLTVDLESLPELSEEALGAWHALLNSLEIKE